MFRVALLSTILLFSTSLESDANANRVVKKTQTVNGTQKKTKTTGVKRPGQIRHRSHLSAKLLPRLHPKTQKNALATVPIVVMKQGQKNEVNLGHGTGFFVTAPNAGGRAILMTNHHVMENAKAQFAAVKIDGNLMRLQTRVITTSEKLDYALVEVTLPKGAKISTVTLAKKPKGKNEHIYSVGFPSTNLLGAENLVGKASAWTKANTTKPAPEGTSPILAAGNVLAQSPQVIALGKANTADVEKAYRQKNTDYFNLPGAPGGSGSAVFSRSSHNVVGLLHGAHQEDGKVIASAVTPMKLILKDVSRNLKSLPAADRAQVQRLLGPTK